MSRQRRSWKSDGSTLATGAATGPATSRPRRPITPAEGATARSASGPDDADVGDRAALRHRRHAADVEDDAGSGRARLEDLPAVEVGDVAEGRALGHVAAPHDLRVEDPR